MHLSIIGRLVRPAILLAAGVLLGQGALAIAAPSAPAATTQTRIASCAGYNFHPINSSTTFIWTGRQLIRTTDDGDGWFMCHLDLPHRAVVTKVRFTVKDQNDRISLDYCGLVRTSLGTTGETTVVGLPILSTGLSGQPGTRRYTDSSIAGATVDNGAFAYSLQCRMVLGAGLHNIANASFGIIGADVTYRISAANG